MVQTLPTFCGPRSYEITPGGEGIFFENFVVNLSAAVKNKLLIGPKLPTGLKPAQIYIFFSIKISPARLLYSDFDHNMLSATYQTTDLKISYSTE